MRFSLLVPQNPHQYTLRWRQNAACDIPTLYISNIILRVTEGPGNNTNCTLDGFDDNQCVNVDVQLIAVHIPILYVTAWICQNPT